MAGPAEVTALEPYLLDWQVQAETARRRRSRRRKPAPGKTPAEHRAAAEQLLAELESGHLQSFAGAKQVAALVAVTHCLLADAAERKQ
jgi:hypothetical protein